ncbi:MAG: right-handed parallel beta-helix repeat-containing protein [Candidatus Limnocylindrales bacterium]
MLGAMLLGALMPGAASAAGTTYQVDCSAGNDSASGTSTSTAWRTLSRANNANLVPGDRLLLKRGCTWTGPLNARWSGTSSAPITIGAYGSGELPKIQNGHENVKVTGDWMVIENIWTRSDVPSRDGGCENQPQGWRAGFRLMSGANNNTVRYSRADEQYIGILLEGGSSQNKILNNTLRNNNMKDTDPSSDAGAVGISLMGNDNEVAYNDISGSDACSRQWGRDGAAVEVFGGSRNRIHHNTASQNHNFTELGKVPSADNTYSYNRVTSSLTTANFLVTRGSSNGYGPVYRTKLYNNTVHLSGSQSYAIQCYGGCGTDILTMKGNIVVAQDRVGYADRAFDESNNLYWRPGGSPKVYFPISSSSMKVDPRFVNIGSGDLHLQSASPAIDKGSTAVLSLFNRDLDGNSVPQGGAPDIGAYERTTTTAVTSATTTYVTDSFGRNVSGGWGTAPTGGSYRYAGTTADFGVNGYEATVRVAPGRTQSASLGTVLAADVNALVRFRTDRLASGSGNVCLSRRSPVGRPQGGVPAQGADGWQPDHLPPGNPRRGRRRDWSWLGSRLRDRPCRRLVCLASDDRQRVVSGDGPRPGLVRRSDRAEHLEGSADRLQRRPPGGRLAWPAGLRLGRSRCLDAGPLRRLAGHQALIGRSHDRAPGARLG